MYATHDPVRPLMRPFYFSLVFALSAPLWWIGGATDLQLMPGLSVSALMGFCPMAAALILIYSLAPQQHRKKRVHSGAISRHAEPCLRAVSGLRIIFRYAPRRARHGGHRIGGGRHMEIENTDGACECLITHHINHRKVSTP
jgi:uncharacterized membrane protein